jgi:phosphoserine aminotransferase
MLSRPFDVSKFGLIYAGAQKNIGPAGLTIVIVRDDLIGQVDSKAPTLFDYQNLAKNDSMANTPPTYSWYMAGLVLQMAEEKWRTVVPLPKPTKRKQSYFIQPLTNQSSYQNPVAPRVSLAHEYSFYSQRCGIRQSIFRRSKEG